MALSQNIKNITAQYVEAGYSVADMAKLFGVPYTTMAGRLKAFKLKAINQNQIRDYEITDRNKEICAMYLDGHTLAEAGVKYNVSRERIRQILVKNNIQRRHTGVPKRG